MESDDTHTDSTQYGRTDISTGQILCGITVTGFFLASDVLISIILPTAGNWRYQ